LGAKIGLNDRIFVNNLTAGVLNEECRIINLDAGVIITASDGESRTIGAGEVILAEDISGKGHLSQAINGQLRHSIFVPIE
jgi:hypothetical protein